MSADTALFVTRVENRYDKFIQNENSGMLIKAYRYRNKLTQRQLAKILYVSESSVRGWEQGKSRIPFRVWNHISSDSK